MGKFQKKDDKAVKADPLVSAAAPTKDANEKREVKAKAKSRDFSSDLASYLQQWKGTQGSSPTPSSSGWKFNKVLQNWALAECLNGECIAKNLFHDLLPYLCSVQGGARDRLLERCDVLTLSVDDQAEAGVSTEAKRARKVVAKLRKAEPEAEGDAAAAAEKEEEE